MNFRETQNLRPIPEKGQVSCNFYSEACNVLLEMTAQITHTHTRTHTWVKTKHEEEMRHDKQ